MKLATPAILLLADQASASVLSCDITHKTSLLAPIDKEVKYINNEQEFFIDGSSGLAMDRQIFKPLSSGGNFDWQVLKGSIGVFPHQLDPFKPVPFFLNINDK